MPARMPHFSLSVAARESLEAALDDEGADPGGVALLLLVQVRPGKDEEVVGDVGQRDPHLLAGDEIAIPLLDRDGLNAADVAAGGRFGQAVGRDLLALRLRHEVALLLVLGAPGQERQAVEPGVHRHDHAQRRVDVLELLADDAEADVVHAGAAVFLRDRTAEQAKLGHLRQDVRVESMLAIELANLRRHRARAPLAHRLLEQPLLLGEIEINHESPLLLKLPNKRTHHSISRSRGRRVLRSLGPTDLGVFLNDAAGDSASQRLRDPRPLRRHDEGRDPGDLPGRDPGRHHPRHRSPRRPRRRPGTGGQLQVLSRRDDLRGRRGSRRRVVAPRYCG